MRDIWSTALEAMRRAGVLVPVLNAIGCGAFRGPFAEVPYLWAMALWEVLTVFDSFVAVFVCFPHFPADQYNLRCFQQWFQTNDARVFLLSHHSAPHVAQCLSVLLGKPDAVGILNPSDTLAVRKGHIGMFWDGGGHIALEECLAVTTTCLTMNRYLNTRLWNDQTRWKKIRPPTIKGCSNNQKQRRKRRICFSRL